MIADILDKKKSAYINELLYYKCLRHLEGYNKLHVHDPRCVLNN